MEIRTPPLESLYTVRVSIYSKICFDVPIKKIQKVSGPCGRQFRSFLVAPRALDEQSAVSVICSVLESRPGQPSMVVDGVANAGNLRSLC